MKANASPERKSKWLLEIAESEDDDHDPDNPTSSGYSDPDSKAFRGIGPGYNAQAAVDTTSQLIVGAKVVTDINDSKQLLPMIDEVNQVTGNGDKSMEVYADTGYSSADVYAKLSNNPKIEAYVPVRESTSHKPNHPYSQSRFTIDIKNKSCICPEGHPMYAPRQPGRNKDGYAILKFRGKVCQNCHAKELCTKGNYRNIVVLVDEHHRQNMRDKMKTHAGKRAMKIRKTTVEPVFGIIKEAMGFRHFRLRSLKSVTAEWLLIAIAFNLKKINKIDKTTIDPAISLRRSLINLSFLLFHQLERRSRSFQQHTKLIQTDRTGIAHLLTTTF